MLPTNKIMQKLTICLMMAVFACTTAMGQTTQPLQPTWWFGVSGAANFNFYDGSTQRLDNSLFVPTVFHKAKGIKPYGSLLVEYRPGRIWGFMLNVAYDARGAKFDGVEAPCNCPATLQTDIDYVAIEPSLRLGFKSNNLFFFAGPRVAFDVNRRYFYTQLKQPNTSGDLSAIKSTQLSGQVGVGYDIMLSSAAATTKVSLSPFVSYHPYFGQEPRSIETLNITTFRAGVALKFGAVHKAAVVVVPPPVVVPVVAAVAVHDFVFTVHGPSGPMVKNQVSETLPLLNTVFFDEGSAQIPSRYVVLTSDQASAFRENQLQNQESESMSSRSAGQLIVYHNVLNILGDRMRANPGATITLDGSSAKGPQEARASAEAVKLYLVNVFGISASRIVVHGSFKAVPSSGQPGGKTDLALFADENRRVDIETTSPELIAEVGGGMMRPVQLTETQMAPAEVVLNVDSAKLLLKSWSVDVTDSKGTVQHFGPFMSDQQGIPQSAILGNSPDGDYTLVMTGETNTGTSVTKGTSIHLVHPDLSVQKGFRYSVVFDFDRFKTVAEYKNFLTTVVAPLIVEGATVTIHGHTDITGSVDYNQKLSESRAQDAQKILVAAIANSGRDHVTFATSGMGEDPTHAPFDNALPEGRFYNRTVIIDIAPVKQ